MDFALVIKDSSGQLQTVSVLIVVLLQMKMNVLSVKALSTVSKLAKNVQMSQILILLMDNSQIKEIATVI